MGSLMSVMGKGMPTTQMINMVMGTLYTKFTEKDIKTFEEFHIAILDMIITLNAALPGKHYDVPPANDVEKCFIEWKGANEQEKEKVFLEFMKKSMQLSKLDDKTLIIGLAIPPATMAAKRAGEKLPQLNIIKFIPDVIFVPSATVLGLITVKLSRKMFTEKMAS